MSNPPNLQSVLEALEKRREPLVYGLTVEQERCRETLTTMGKNWVDLPQIGDSDRLAQIVSEHPEGTLFLSEELYFWLVQLTMP